ncbi:hypothetical protein BT69DRAFT_1288244 [Atractiella rhizophila]|nr:hypothetical protein BT69DRAFT_1288244 [Atractiella rhizophila]
MAAASSQQWEEKHGKPPLLARLGRKRTQTPFNCPPFPFVLASSALPSSAYARS